MTDNPYRTLPSVDRLLARKEMRGLGDAAAPLIRQALESARAAIAKGDEAPDEAQIAEQVAGLARLVMEPSLRPVINSTGVVIHTNLGRAPLPASAIAAMAAVSHGYSNLEFDLAAGERGSRYAHLEAALCQLTGAPAAIAVNNNASALLLVLSVLAAQREEGDPPREVIISRGQAVEIGGGFRIPDVMAQSGIKLVEVGTTNRTYLRDHEKAITPDTAAIMRVHASNFRVTGFTEQPSIQDLARVAHEHGVLLLDDLGSGCLLDTARFGLTPEPTVAESISAGADLVMFSADKLLGGPQAGIIAGREDIVDQARRHPLARAVRMDKATIAGLHATLLHYLRGEALTHVPVWRMISTPLEEIEARAKRWKRSIGAKAKIIDARSMVGGGSLPEESLPTKAVAIAGDGAATTELARRLRTDDAPVVGRIERNALLLDPRTVSPDDDGALVAAVKRALAG
jgi:L-seryl-tRNA(Ser) seleniumtransferase